MGIDIYARWRGQTKKEEDNQLAGFSVVHGHVGYLREAYHGNIYATRFLCKEAFESRLGQVKISAAVLRERLPETLKLVEQRERETYKETDEEEIERKKKSFTDFVELCEGKEKETGEPCNIIASY